MLKTLLAILAFTTATAALAIEPPVLPPKLTAGVPIQAAYVTGPCDSISLNDQGLSHLIDVDDNVIDVTLSYVGPPWFVEVCIVGVNTTNIPIGTLEQGDYTLRTFIASADSVLPADPADRIFLFDTNFSVGPAASAVPALSVPNTALLILLISGLGLFYAGRIRSH